MFATILVCLAISTVLVLFFFGLGWFADKFARFDAGDEDLLFPYENEWLTKAEIQKRDKTERFDYKGMFWTAAQIAEHERLAEEHVKRDEEKTPDSSSG